jgi:hypothetical protein
VAKLPLPAPSRLKVITVGISMRRCNSGVCVGFRAFQMCSAVGSASEEARTFVLETAPSGFGKEGARVDDDAV